MYQLDMGIILDAMRDLQIQQKCQGRETDVQKTCPGCRAPATTSPGHEKVWTTFSAEGQTSRFILPDVCITCNKSLSGPRTHLCECQDCTYMKKSVFMPFESVGQDSDSEDDIICNNLGWHTFSNMD